MVARDRGLIGRVQSSILVHWPSADVQALGAGQWILPAICEHGSEVVLLDPAVGGVTLETITALRLDEVPVITLAWDERQIVTNPALLDTDDYVLRPLCPLELVARIDVARRRSRGPAEVSDLPPPSGESLAFDDGVLWLDFANRRAEVHQRPVYLTRTEFDLLAQLIRCRGFVVPNRTLREHTWRGGSDEHAGYLWIQMRRLRDKIEPNPTKPRYVIAERGFGYRFARPVA